jgi:ABC-2 type transport system ATP-binding protein
MIEARALTKRYGETVAVDGLTFTVQPGIVTGFVGPNGAGKSTTMRMILGLDAPTSGSVTVNGHRYADLRAPLHEVGALLEARAVHTGRSARNHLLALAATHGISARRVDVVIDMVGLESVASKRAGSFSLGMGQRLGIASALLGDPQVLILDEPVNGLDPDGILWIRNLLKSLASEGRTIFVSSHLMSEMAQTAEHLIVIGRGRVLADTTVQGFIDHGSMPVIRVESPDAADLREGLTAAGATVSSTEPTVLEVTGMTAAQVGDVAFDRHARLHGLTTVQASLEEAFMNMTHDEVVFHGETTSHLDPSLGSHA